MPGTKRLIETDPALVQARLVLYRFASLLLLDPRAGSWEQLDALRSDNRLKDAADILRRDPVARAKQLGKGELPLAELNSCAALAKLPSSRETLNRQYESTFGLVVSGACPPYETEYIDGKFAVQRAQTMADISGFYRAFGLRTSSDYPERPDHIVLELEFMAFLLGMEVQSFQASPEARQDRGIVCREAQERFFRDHLSWWTTAFAHLLAREAGDGFYGQAAHMLAALITTERARFGLPLPQACPQPSPLERPEECEGCGLASP